MSPRFAFVLLAAAPLAACGAPSLETRTFELRYLGGGTVAEMIRPYVFDDRPKAPGRFSVTERTLTVRETRDNLERISRVLAEHDRAPANVRLLFQIIRADGAGAADPAIAEVETALRQLFRFRGYRLEAQAVTVATPGTEIRQSAFGPGGSYVIEGGVEAVGGQGDSGAVRMEVSLFVEGAGRVLATRLNVAIGQTALIGGQAGTGPGALILAVRPERAAP